MRPGRAALALALALAGVGLARAAEPPTVQAEIRRAVGIVGGFTSEEPALRQERGSGEPSPGFLLGAALGAWMNAAAQLDFDLKNPQGIGPAHAHLGQEGADILREECREEAVAFEHMETRAKALGLTPEAAAAAGGVASGGTAEAWIRRRQGPVAGCRL